MVSRHDSVRAKHLLKLADSVGTIIFCTRCFRNLGRNSITRTREVLLASHECLEAQLPKQPTAPPPYN
jgi:hypothetical protein